MARLEWDKDGERRFEAGVDQVVLYPMGANGYGDGVAWNGITAINENPGGADETKLWADNLNYATLRSAETYGCSIEAYTYPDEWAECDGSAKAGTSGAFVGQQPRKAFGLCFRTKIGDDQHPGMNKGYKLHIIYNCTASPAGRGYTTINENPDAITMSWDATSTPTKFSTFASKFDATCTIIVDSTQTDATKLADLETLLYGDTNATASLPNPDTVLSTLGYTI